MQNPVLVSALDRPAFDRTQLCLFQRLLRLGFITTATSLNGSQPNFSQCLALTWAGRLYIYIFGGRCSVTEFCQVENSHCVLPSLVLSYWQRYCTAVEQWARAKLCGVEHRAPPIFSRATITMRIGPRSSFSYIVRIIYYGSLDICFLLFM